MQVSSATRTDISVMNFFFTALPARIRLAISLGVCGVAVAGLLVSDVLEGKFPANGSSEEQKM